MTDPAAWPAPAKLNLMLRVVGRRPEARLRPPLRWLGLEVPRDDPDRAERMSVEGAGILLDYSKSLLRQAQERLGRGENMVYVAASFYDMPFVAGALDAAMMVRVIHHVERVPALLGEVARILTGGGTYLLEFASKLHLKSLVRWLLRRQDWSPLDPEPLEFVELNFDFHPRWMGARLAEAGLPVERVDLDAGETADLEPHALHAVKVLLGRLLLDDQDDAFADCHLMHRPLRQRDHSRRRGPRHGSAWPPAPAAGATRIHIERAVPLLLQFLVQ